MAVTTMMSLKACLPKIALDLIIALSPPPAKSVFR
jgi:hypothetical protein